MYASIYFSLLRGSESRFLLLSFNETIASNSSEATQINISVRGGGGFLRFIRLVTFMGGSLIKLSTDLRKRVFIIIKK